MKADVLSTDGNKVKEIELPGFFENEVREDVLLRAIETIKTAQPYAPYEMAGKQASASGKIRHGRRKWRTAYGKGISRVPRKIMWRRGDQFYWIAAETSGARKGRRSHPPKVLSRIEERKINKKEMKLALESAIIATAKEDYVRKRYGSYQEAGTRFPIVVQSEAAKLDRKKFDSFVEKIFGDNIRLIFKKKKVRAGIGKLRSRRYKENEGMLMVVGNNEESRLQGVDIVKVSNLDINDLARGKPGRIVIYTEKAIEELGRRIGR